MSDDNYYETGDKRMHGFMVDIERIEKAFTPQRLQGDRPSDIYVAVGSGVMNAFEGALPKLKLRKPHNEKWRKSLAKSRRLKRL